MGAVGMVFYCAEESERPGQIPYMYVTRNPARSPLFLTAAHKRAERDN